MMPSSLRGCIILRSRQAALCCVCALLSFFAVMLYAGQFILEAKELEGMLCVCTAMCVMSSGLTPLSLLPATAVAETTCTIYSHKLVDGVCYEKRCPSTEPDNNNCPRVAVQCYQIKYRVSLVTNNKIGMVGNTEPVGSYRDSQEANNDALAPGDQAPCYYIPGDTSISMQPIPMESSAIPVGLFSVLFLLQCSASVIFNCVARQDEEEARQVTNNYV